MNTDSSVNVVVFRVLIGRRLENVLGEGPTRAVDGIRKVWNELVAGFGVRAANVRRVYAQWEPTRGDLAFLAADFPQKVKVTHSFRSFRRPAARRDWGDGTPEFICAVEEFEGLRYTVRSMRTGPRRPWWRYWDWPGEAINPLVG